MSLYVVDLCLAVARALSEAETLVGACDQQPSTKMQTTLPDLPYTNFGILSLYPDCHSASRATPRRYPRKDYDTMRPWTSFPTDVHGAIQTAMNTAGVTSASLTIGSTMPPIAVANEEMIRAHAFYALHQPVQSVVQLLGVAGTFMVPGGGNVAIIGDPDLSWIVGGGQLHPKLVAEYKTWWVTDLSDFLQLYTGARKGLSENSLDALYQTYGYMTFNNLQFGVLSSWKCAVFLRRAETPAQKTLDFYVVELESSNPPVSMLKAWVGMVLLANNNWFYASPSIHNPPLERSFNLKDSKAAKKEHDKALRNVSLVMGRYPCLSLDFRLCIFDLSSIRPEANGCVVDARFLQASGRDDLLVVCKAVDATRYHPASNLLEQEMDVYASLQSLQGKVIPRLYGFYQVWNIIHLLALQPVGNAIGGQETIDNALREKMKGALRYIHAAGYIHGDISRSNFCRTNNGDVFLVDLERSRQSQNQAEFDEEMKKVNRL